MQQERGGAVRLMTYRATPPRFRFNINIELVYTYTGETCLLHTHTGSMYNVEKLLSNQIELIVNLNLWKICGLFFVYLVYMFFIFYLRHQLCDIIGNDKFVKFKLLLNAQ